MKTKAVIFDVDGVLINTVPYHFKAWKKMFKEEGVNFTFKDYLDKVNGVPRLQGIKNILKGAREKRILTLAERKQLYLTEMINENPPQPLDGVVSLLKKLKKQGIKLAAASSSKNAPLLLKNANLSKYFSTIVSGYDFTKSKPNAELFLLASKRLGIKPSDCLVIEDAAIGIMAANNGGMQTIGVLTSKDKKIKNLADVTVKSLKEQKSILKILSI